jgi:hypothetical protein
VHTWHGLSASLLGLSILTAEADAGVGTLIPHTD